MRESAFDFDLIKQKIVDSANDSTIYVGADSKVFSKRGEAHAAFVTVIIIHHGSRKGAEIFRATRVERFYGDIKGRLLTEVADAIHAGLEIADLIEDRGFEIHLDINRGANHLSSSIVKQATGYVLGTLGREPKLKPFAFAATNVADRDCVKYAKSANDTPSQKRKYRRAGRK